MTMTKARGWWLLGGLLLLAVATMFIAALPRLFPPAAATGGSSGLPAPVITVSFIGYTNGTDGSVQAQFAVSNTTPWRVSYEQHPFPMVLTNGQWSGFASYDQYKILAPHQQVVVWCAKPVGAEAWRLQIFHGPIPSGPVFYLARFLSHLPLRWWARLDGFIQDNSSVNMTLAQSAIRTD